MEETSSGIVIRRSTACRLGAVVDLGENTDAKGKRCQKPRHRPSYFGRLLQDNPRLFAFLFHAPYLSGQGQVLQRASGRVEQPLFSRKPL